MSHKRTHHAMSRNRYRCHTREHNFMQCPERYTNVTQENTASCNVQNQVQMSHKRAQLHAMSRNRHHVLPDATQENTTSCNVQKQTPRPSGRHTREHNIRQVPGKDRKKGGKTSSRSRHHRAVHASDQNTASGVSKRKKKCRTRRQTGTANSGKSQEMTK